jgi:peptidoglycan hydrolase-like protein with peptidoglycan-binding domain
MNVSRRLLCGAAVFALACGALSAPATAEDAATPVPAPPAVESSPLAAPSPVSAPKAQPSPLASAPAATPSPSAAAAPTPTAAASAPKSPTPAAPIAVAAPRPSATSAAAPADALGAEPIPVEIAPKPKKKLRPAPPPLETALSNDPTPTLSPQTFFATQKAEEHYAHIVQEGGWATDLPPLRVGSHAEAVAELRRHLELEGDLSPSGAPSRKWDAALTAAVKHFQARMGLRQTGEVVGETLKAINVSAEARRLELAASAARLSNLHFEFAPRYVVVNLPSTSVEAVENGRVAHRYVAIVGDPDHPSPEISAHISVINLNPTWTVPTSIIKKEIIPHMQRDPGYLSREKIRILDGQLHEVDPRSVDWSSERAANYILRQDSGAGNSLGSIRIGMPNKLAVYMHDTPGKALFGRDFRFLSHGCVRVQGVYDYAAWLLEGTPAPTGAWDKPALLDKVKSKERFDIKLAHAVPVIWVYLTGWANEDGVVNFRNDVYGLDPNAEANAAAAAASAQADASAPAEPAPAPAAAAGQPLTIFDLLRGR